MSSKLVYTVQFSEEEFDQLVGDLYYYYLHLKYRQYERVEKCLDDEQKQYFQSQLDKVLRLQSKLEKIRNQANKTNPLYILEKINE